MTFDPTMHEVEVYFTIMSAMVLPFLANHNRSHNRYCKPVFMTSTHAIFGPPAGKKDLMTFAINADPDQTARIWDCAG